MLYLAPTIDVSPLTRLPSKPFAHQIERGIQLKDFQQLNVFVVDDEPIIAHTLGSVLRVRGFAATSFVNPFKALERTQTVTPDLIITDVLMPQMSGIDLAIKVKELCPNCKVLLCSGQAETVDLLSAAQARGYDFDVLSKPVHPTDLLFKLHSLAVTPHPVS
jgi:CheY-like chemotaxis protein